MVNKGNKSQSWKQEQKLASWFLKRLVRVEAPYNISSSHGPNHMIPLENTPKIWFPQVSGRYSSEFQMMEKHATRLSLSKASATV
jgi:hypothetical protein